MRDPNGCVWCQKFHRGHQRRIDSGDVMFAQTPRFEKGDTSAPFSQVSTRQRR